MPNMIGTKPNQIPVNGMLGDLAFMSKGTFKTYIGEINLAWFNPKGDGIADDQRSLQRACIERFERNATHVLINSGSLYLGSDVDCLGAKLVCAGTKFLGPGRLWNNTGIIGGYINGVNQDEIHKAPISALCTNSSPKAVSKVSNTEMRVIGSRARNGGFFGVTLLYNSFMTSDSVGGTGEFWRCTQVQNIKDCYCYKKEYSSLSGVWGVTDINLSSGGTGIPYKVHNTSEIGAWIEFAFTGSKVSLGLYESGSSTAGAEIKIDGALVETVNLNSVINGVVIKEYFCSTGGNHTIRVEKPTSGILYVAGINAGKLSNIPVGTDIDYLAYGVLDASLAYPTARDYCISGGAQDYAFHDGALLAGSVHGGELSDFASWRFDGNTIDISAEAVGAIHIVKSLLIEQRTNFGWDAEKRFDTRSITDFTTDGGWTFSCQLRARPIDGIELYSSYTSMTTAAPTFDTVDYPTHVQTIEANGTYFPLGRAEYVRQRNFEGDALESFLSIASVEDNKHGGVWVWRVPDAYNKVYYGPASFGKLNIKNLAFTTRKQFS